MTRNGAWAVFSCDLDPIDRHLEGYGIDAPPCDRIYRAAVPRLLALLDELGVPGVLFSVARDARAERQLLRRAVAAGHEVASHSMTHPQPFRTLSDEALATEITESRTTLSEVIRTDVCGFRAPAWDVDARVLRAVAAAGYRYDASIFPTPLLLASRIAAYRRSASKRSLFSMALLRNALAPIRPHRCAGIVGELVEFPVAVSRLLRIPMYHTLTHLVPIRLFTRALDKLLDAGIPLSYEFHAVDLLDMDADGVDPRMVRHPGMSIPLAHKRAVLRDILRHIASRRHVITYKQALEGESRLDEAHPARVTA